MAHTLNKNTYETNGRVGCAKQPDISIPSGRPGDNPPGQPGLHIQSSYFQVIHSSLIAYHPPASKCLRISLIRRDPPLLRELRTSCRRSLHRERPATVKTCSCQHRRKGWSCHQLLSSPAATAWMITINCYILLPKSIASLLGQLHCN